MNLNAVPVSCGNESRREDADATVSLGHLNGEPTKQKAPGSTAKLDTAFGQCVIE